ASSGSLLVCQEVVDPVDSRPPQLLDAVQERPGSVDGVDVGAHELLAPLPFLGDEPGALEDGDVLLHGGEAHRVALRQRRHAVPAPDGQRDDVAPSAVAKGVEDPVDIGLGTLIYNHLVVYSHRKTTCTRGRRAQGLGATT